MSASLHNFFSDFDSYREAVSSGLTYLPSLAESKVERASVATTAAIAAWSFVLSVGLSNCFNFFLFRDPRLLVAVARKVGAVDELEALCHKCLNSGLLVALTLKSGKVYVGVPEGSSPLDAERTWIVLWPMASGYRDAKQKLCLTTFYAPHYEKAASGDEDVLAYDDFRVVLPRAEIETAQSFDLPTYASFSEEVPASQVSLASIAPTEVSGNDEKRVAQDAAEVDNASALTAEIIAPRDATLVRVYFGMVVSISLSIVLVSGSALSTLSLLSTLVCVIALFKLRKP